MDAQDHVDGTDTAAAPELGTPTPDAPDASNRRRFLAALGGAFAGAALSPRQVAVAQRIVRAPRFPTSGPLAPVPRLPSSTIVKLVNRVTFGITPQELDRARGIGFMRYLDEQLDHTRIDDHVVDAYVANTWPLLSQGPDGLYQQSLDVVTRQLSESTLYRAVYSKRQLYERMVEFWTDHFTIYLPKVGYLKIVDDRDVIRKYALGSFPQLLWASAHSPAMLQYLDQPQSRGNNPNQNYAREIMELHSLGVEGGYTQDDVANLSRIFTGWTLQGRGNFAFDATGHDFTAKVFLGKNYPAQASSVGGAAIAEGEDAVRTLATHPNTARFIGAKLARYLLQYDAPDSAIQGAIDAFTRTGGDIPAMIRAILTPANVAQATAKYKRPFHYVASTLRAMNTRLASTTYSGGRALTLVGQPLFMHEQPDGYPDNVVYWAGNVLPRWNYASLVASGSTEIVTDVSGLLRSSAQGVVDAINAQLFGGEMPAKLATALATYVGSQGTNAARVREACALAMSSAEFMWF